MSGSFSFPTHPCTTKMSLPVAPVDVAHSDTVAVPQPMGHHDMAEVAVGAPQPHGHVTDIDRHQVQGEHHR